MFSRCKLIIQYKRFIYFYNHKSMNDIIGYRINYSLSIILLYILYISIYMYFTCILHTSKRRGVADQAIFCGNSNITLGKFMDGFRLKMKNVARKKSFSLFLCTTLFILNVQHQVVYLYSFYNTLFILNVQHQVAYLYSFYNTLFILNVQLQMLYLYHSIATQCTALSTLCTVPLVNVQHKVLYLNCTSAILIFSLGISASFTRFAELASLI